MTFQKASDPDPFATKPANQLFYRLLWPVGIPISLRRVSRRSSPSIVLRKLLGRREVSPDEVWRRVQSYDKAIERQIVGAF
jgi:hypothetical protein